MTIGEQTRACVTHSTHAESPPGPPGAPIDLIWAESPTKIRAAADMQNGDSVSAQQTEGRTPAKRASFRSRQAATLIEKCEENARRPPIRAVMRLRYGRLEAAPSQEICNAQRRGPRLRVRGA